MIKNYFEMEEVAEYLKLEVATVKTWAKTEGHKDFRKYLTKIGRRNIILEENLTNWMKGLPPQY